MRTFSVRRWRLWTAVLAVLGLLGTIIIPVAATAAEQDCKPAKMPGNITYTTKANEYFPYDRQYSGNSRTSTQLGVRVLEDYRCRGETFCPEVVLVARKSRLHKAAAKVPQEGEPLLVGRYRPGKANKRQLDKIKPLRILMVGTYDQISWTMEDWLTRRYGRPGFEVQLMTAKRESRVREKLQRFSGCR